MSKREFLQRYVLIIAKVRKKPSTFQEIADYLAYESEVQKYKFQISKRTFDRDLEEIRSLYNINIQYNYSKRAYEIESEQSEVRDRLLEAFDIFHTLNVGESLSGLVYFENRRLQGTENLFGLLHAIRNQLQIAFSYTKFWDETSSQRKVEPLALKEFKNRWYILANDLNDNRVKTFALDRLDDLEVTRKKFNRPADFNMVNKFNHCFGIISPDDGQEIEEVVLSFTPDQGKYIKTLPLHESQVVLVDNTDELQIRLNLYITRDFIMEILSHGADVKVIRPDSLVDEVKSVYRCALNQY